MTWATILVLSFVNLSWCQDCSVTKQIDPGVATKLPCVFPFTYKGVTYNHCTNIDHSEKLEWCSTKTDANGVHVSGGGYWGVCEDVSCPHDPKCPEGWSRLRSGCYKVLEESQNKFESEKECMKQGGYLASIDNDQELEHIRDWYVSKVQNQCLYKADILWIGAQYDTEKKVWISDKTEDEIQYTHWLDTEPNSEKENCIAIFANSHFSNDFDLKQFGWFDFKCGSSGMDFYKNWRLDAKGLCERDTDDEFVDTSKKAEQVMMDNGCYDGWSEAGKKCYLFEDHPATYREAKQFCGERGGYLAEMDSEEEYEAVIKLWRRIQLNNSNSCGDQMTSWWIGLTDLAKEGKWISDKTGKKPKFTKWNGDEPNNFGGKVPGEDCAVAGLWSEDMAWYDVPCIIRGFAISKETTASFNPLCQHEKFTKEKYTWDVEGLNEDWVEIGSEVYKFIKTPYGVTQPEAKEICEVNGGFLANIVSEEQRLGLQRYYLDNLVPKPKSYFLAALDFLTGSPDEIKHAWWVGASDEQSDGHWVWQEAKENVTDSPWFFFGRGIPGTDIQKFTEFGDEDCAMVLDKANFLGIDDWGENEKYRPQVEEEDSFKMMMGNCFSRMIIPDYFNFMMHPLCQGKIIVD